jgi:hypothetical protein
LRDVSIGENEILLFDADSDTPVRLAAANISEVFPVSDSASRQNP